MGKQQVVVRLAVQAGPGGQRYVFESPAAVDLADARALWEAEATVNRLTELRVHVSLVEPGTTEAE